MKWGNKEISELTTSHLTNLIPYIKRVQLSTVEKLVGKYTEFAINSLKYAIESRINCIQSELDFRNKEIDNRTQVGHFNRFAEQFIHEFQTNEKKYRLGNWQTQKEFLNESRIRSDEKFEDNFGHSPYQEDWEDVDCYFHDNEFTN